MIQRVWSDNQSKYEFGVNHLTFLGHFVTAQGIQPLATRQNRRDTAVSTT